MEHEARDRELAARQFAFEQQKHADEMALKKDELALKVREIDQQQTESQQRIAQARADMVNRWWSVAVPLFAAAVGAIVSVFVVLRQGASQMEIEKNKNIAQQNIEIQKNEAEHELASSKNRFDLIAKAIDPSDKTKTLDNLKFLISVHLLDDPRGEILSNAKKYTPSLTDRPSSGIPEIQYGGTLPQLPTQRLLKGVTEQDRTTMPKNTTGASIAGLRLLKAALAEYGVVEQGGRWTSPRIKQYMAAARIPIEAPWSGAFLSFCLEEAKIGMPERSGVIATLYAGFAKKGWIRDSDEYKPVPGDIAFQFVPLFGRNDARPHQCGIVFECAGTTASVIEGNSRPIGNETLHGVAVLKRKISLHGHFKIRFAHVP